MIHLFRDPFAIWILGGTAMSLVLTRTRLASWSILSALLVFVLSAEVACFDGRQHLTEKFDATLFVWGRAVEVRALAGLAIMSLAAPIGAVVAKMVGAGRGALLGAAGMGPFGLGLLTSSVQLQLSMGTILAEGTPPHDRFEHLSTAIVRSTWLLSTGTIASVVACLAIVVALTRRPVVVR